MSNAELKVAPHHQPPDIADGFEFEAPYIARTVVEKHHLVGGRATLDLDARRAGQVNRGDLVRRADEQAGVLTGAIEKGPVITVAKLQNPQFSWRRHSA